MAPRKKTKSDYIAHGTDEHAALLGLTPAPEGEPLVIDGWTLTDPLSFGANATELFLLRTLRSKVNELNGQMPKVQSDDPTEPGYAPEMWRPSEEPVSGII